MQTVKKYFRAFRDWTHRRPFGGGICLVISAILIGLPSLNNFRIGDLILTVSTISGVSTVVLAIAMGVCAVAALLWSHVRVIAGIAAMIVALVAFPAANFGGYVLGTLLGVVGASLVLAWRPLDDDPDTDAVTVGGTTAPAVLGSGADAEQPTTDYAVVDAPTAENPVVPENPVALDPAAADAPTQTLPVHEATPETPASAPDEPRAEG